MPNAPSRARGAAGHAAGAPPLRSTAAHVPSFCAQRSGQPAAAGVAAAGAAAAAAWAAAREGAAAVAAAARAAGVRAAAAVARQARPSGRGLPFFLSGRPTLIVQLWLLCPLQPFPASSTASPVLDSPAACPCCSADLHHQTSTDRPCKATPAHGMWDGCFEASDLGACAAAARVGEIVQGPGWQCTPHEVPRWDM